MSARNPPKRRDEFLDAYIEAALFSSNDESTEQGGEPLDANYGPSDIAPATMRAMERDCADFVERFGHLILDEDENGSPAIRKHGRWMMAGHDFWLNRNGHGAGFWDGDWPQHGDELDKAAESYGDFELYVGDDDLIYAVGHETDEGAGPVHPGCIDRRRLGEMMSPWGGDSGSGLPVYAVGSYYSGGHAYPDRAMVERAIAEVERMIPLADQGMHGWTRKDASDLRTIARGLKCYLTLDYPREAGEARRRSHHRAPPDRRDSTTGQETGMRESRRAHHVSDFSSLEALVAHAQREGATHVLVAGWNSRIYYPHGHGYEEARVFHRAGYWHSEAPSDRTVIERLPNGAEPIETYLSRSHGPGRRSAERALATASPRMAASRRTTTGPNATIEERGNGFPPVGSYVPGDDGNLYRVVSFHGPIQTGRGAGAANWVRATVEPADWEDCPEGEEFPAMAIVGNGVSEKRRIVRDYEAVDNRGRRLAGPFKNYGEAKHEADRAGGVVRFVADRRAAEHPSVQGPPRHRHRHRAHPHEAARKTSRAARGGGHRRSHRSPPMTPASAIAVATELSKRVGGTAPKLIPGGHRWVQRNESATFVTYSPQYSQKVVVLVSVFEDGTLALDFFPSEDLSEIGRYENIGNFLYRTVDYGEMRADLKWVWDTVDDYAASWGAGDGELDERDPRTGRFVPARAHRTGRVGPPRHRRRSGLHPHPTHRPGRFAPREAARGSTPYHVYAEDGFESAHRTEAAARQAAQRGSRRRPRVQYDVVKTDAYGLTGGGHGTLIASYRGGRSLNEAPRRPPSGLHPRTARLLPGRIGNVRGGTTTRETHHELGARRRPSGGGAEAAGARYAEEQLEGDYFRDWVYEQMAEADRMRRADPQSVLPLETDRDFQALAKNMLQQLHWDTARELDVRDVLPDANPADARAFMRGFRAEIQKPAVRSWVADLAKEAKEEIERQAGGRGAGERRPLLLPPGPR
jgi:hypothetical protein